MLPSRIPWVVLLKFFQHAFQSLVRFLESFQPALRYPVHAIIGCSQKVLWITGANVMCYEHPHYVQAHAHAFLTKDQRRSYLEPKLNPHQWRLACRTEPKYLFVVSPIHASEPVPLCEVMAYIHTGSDACTGSCKDIAIVGKRACLLFNGIAFKAHPQGSAYHRSWSMSLITSQLSSSEISLQLDPFLPERPQLSLQAAPWWPMNMWGRTPALLGKCRALDGVDTY